jgi:hypothetical protein
VAQIAGAQLAPARIFIPSSSKPFPPNLAFSTSCLLHILTVFQYFHAQRVPAVPMTRAKTWVKAFRAMGGRSPGQPLGVGLGRRVAVSIDQGSGTRFNAAR